MKLYNVGEEKQENISKNQVDDKKERKKLRFSEGQILWASMILLFLSMCIMSVVNLLITNHSKQLIKETTGQRVVGRGFTVGQVPFEDKPAFKVMEEEKSEGIFQTGLLSQELMIPISIKNQHGWNPPTIQGSVTEGREGESIFLSSIKEKEKQSKEVLQQTDVTSKEVISQEVVEITEVPVVQEKNSNSDQVSSEEIQKEHSYIKPVGNISVTSEFGNRWGRMHKGIDFGCQTGTIVSASKKGIVEQAGWLSGYGYAVYLNHADGTQTRYAHLSEVLVEIGQEVEQGYEIAKSGNTGNSTGPHLHFEILENQVQINPRTYLSFGSEF